jgi:hypothetical protein
VQRYDNACDLSLKVNFNLLDRSPKRLLSIWMKSTTWLGSWLGNKSIYWWDVSYLLFVYCKAATFHILYSYSHKYTNGHRW